MSRSLKVRSDCIKQAKLALQRNGFGSQRASAEELGLALSTVSRFLTGKTVDYATFMAVLAFSVSRSVSVFADSNFCFKSTHSVARP
jgi:predicted XRE-type DNA-binding protein